jgi:DNA invertase Pin-like site-specific DNA recombinase
MRVSIYARYSSDKQREASIEDQTRLCEERARRENWTVVKRYSDHAISGASLMRRGIQELMQDAQSGKIRTGAPEEIRTPDPRFLVWCSNRPSLCYL